MAKLNADKLKNLARSLKDDGTVKKGGDTPKTETKKKVLTNDTKLSGRKD